MVAGVQAYHLDLATRIATGKSPALEAARRAPRAQDDGLNTSISDFGKPRVQRTEDDDRRRELQKLTYLRVTQMGLAALGDNQVGIEFHSGGQRVA